MLQIKFDYKEKSKFGLFKIKRDFLILSNKLGFLYSCIIFTPFHVILVIRMCDKYKSNIYTHEYNVLLVSSCS